MVRKRLNLFGKILDFVLKALFETEFIVLIALTYWAGNGISIPVYLCISAALAVAIFATYKFYEFIFIK